MESLISIIVPVYKAEKYICKCIDSILKQTINNWELILVDDGSPDSSGKICDEYALLDNRIKVFHKINGGVSSARNYGLKSSVGRYVTFIDSDDWVSSTYLEDFNISDLDNKGVVLVSQGIEQYFPERELYIEVFKYEDKELLIDVDPISIVDNNLLANGCPVAKIFDLDIIRKYNLYFNEGISLNEDHLFVLDYLYYTTTVLTKSKINYTYLYDFTVPSLTKNRHSSKDSLNAALALWKSFDRIRCKYLSINDLLVNYSKEFGPKQLIRASKSTFYENDKITKFSVIADEFKRMVTHVDSLIYCDIYSRSYVYLVNKVGLKTFFLIQLMLNAYVEIFCNLKYFVKHLVHLK